MREYNVFKQLRIDCGLTVAELADYAGKSTFYVIKLEDLLYENLPNTSSIARALAAHLPNDLHNRISVKPDVYVSMIYDIAIKHSQEKLAAGIPFVSQTEWDWLMTH